ncbi:GDP-mannose 4,6-dehydratase [Methanobacterium sp.]|uniref:GDP-mannose 4,6-dehydratase n=1 Tax=Methanobacterium sp. TaxID=2164 RepID=UPI0025DDF7B5|nr:GDP-mannose 4,6-dehydratase [Methanobacterium sp.]MBI5458360.1 GDP-mannose 4,6-dehydratase [Methanobacterium sp.]
MKTVLVTGGAGFIGSHLIERLLIDKKKIILIDDFNDYYDPKIKENNVQEIIRTRKQLNLDDNYFQVYRGDITENVWIDKVFNENNIDIIVHLAAMAGVRPSIEMPEKYYNVNINGTLKILEACKERKIKNFIFASSSSVYGNNLKTPFTEIDNVDYPISPYAASKKAGELLCHTYYHLYDISVACLRFFTVYGPRQRPDLAIHKFTKLILNNKEIPFYGNGNTERDYTYIDDIIDGIIKAMKWINKDEKVYEIFNLGESKTISLNQMVQTLEKVIGKRATINKLPNQPGDVNKTFADISKSKEILGYNPKTDFEDGISKFVEWYKSSVK